MLYQEHLSYLQNNNLYSLNLFFTFSSQIEGRPIKISIGLESAANTTNSVYPFFIYFITLLLNSQINFTSFTPFFNYLK